MGPLNRAPRAAASALLLATAIGAAGTTGISSVLAVDPPTTLPLSGTLVDQHGAALGGVHLVISEEQPPDGGLAGSQVTTAADGSFSGSVYPWGTTSAPATLTIKTPADEKLEVIGASCSQTWGVAVAETRYVTLEGVADPPPAIDLVATTTLLGEVCGVTAKPRANAGAGTGARVTPPPTDPVPASLARSGERHGPALILGFVVGLIAAAALLIPRRGARRRR